MGAAHGLGRRGAVIVELAIVMPVLLLMVFGIIEFGHAAFVRHVMINAATEGAREAWMTGSEEQVMAVVERALADGGIAHYDIVREYTSEEPPGRAETVTLRVPYSEVSLLGVFDNFALTATSTQLRGPLDR